MAVPPPLLLHIIEREGWQSIGQQVRERLRAIVFPHVHRSLTKFSTYVSLFGNVLLCTFNVWLVLNLSIGRAFVSLTSDACTCREETPLNLRTSDLWKILFLKLHMFSSTFERKQILSRKFYHHGRQCCVSAFSTASAYVAQLATT